MVVENRDVVLIRRAAVVGSGAMGAGIAQVIAQAKVPVAIHDVSEDNLRSSRSRSSSGEERRKVLIRRQKPTRR